MVTRLDAMTLKSLEGTEHALGSTKVRFEKGPGHMRLAEKGGEATPRRSRTPRGSATC